MSRCRGTGTDMTKFESFGDAARIGPGTRMECKICWYVYDPAEGDVVWQIPPGTPFAASAAALDLPELLGDEGPVPGGGRQLGSKMNVVPDPALPDPSARLTDAFRAVAQRMRGLAFVNPALDVEAVGFAPVGRRAGSA